MKKKLVSVLLATLLLLTCIPLGAVSVSAADSRVEKAIEWAIAIANDNSHGYSGSSRLGPNYDCSSFIGSAFNYGGFSVNKGLTTSTATSEFTKVGFIRYDKGSVSLQRGDILLRPKTTSRGGHIELYIGNNSCVAAHWDEDGKSGDSSGKEIEVRTKNYCTFCKNGEYTYILRYNTPSPSITYTNIATGTYVIKNNARNQHLNVAYGEDKNAANITVGDFGNWYSQYYEITPSTTTSGYAMRPLCSNTRMVNVYADTVASGKNVCLWDNTGHNSQRWNFEKVSGGYVIRNVQSPSCVLDVEGYGNAYVATYTGAASQIWSIQNAIKYNANGGSNAPATQFKDYDSSIKLSAQKPTRAGYTFLGWAESASAKTAKYAAGDTYTAKENVNLYAVWKKQTYANILSVPSTARYANKGAKVTVPIKAEGDGLKYTWYIKNEGQTKYSKSSVTSATYSATMSSKSKNRRVYCIVKDKHNNSERSKTFILRESVSVITQPKSVTVKKNATAKATVKASGDGLRYQWYVKNAGQSKYSKSSITTATYSAKMTSKANGRRLICYVYDKYGNKVQSKTVVIKMK